jgi:hypothetical protein
MYRDDSRVRASGCQCQTPFRAKETNNSVPATSSSACADPNKLEPDKLSDKELKIIHQYYQTVHAANEVGSLQSVATMNLNMQPSDIKTFGFGGVKAEAVKKLKAPEQGSYFCFKATISVKRKFSTGTSGTKEWFTYQFVDEGAQTNSNINNDVDDVGVGISYLANIKHLVLKRKISMRWETRRKRSSTESTKVAKFKDGTVEDSHYNNDDDIGGGISYLTNINHLLLIRKMTLRWERRKRLSSGNTKMAELKDGTVEDSREKYNHLMKGLLTEPVEDGPRDEEDFKNLKRMTRRPADWEDWKKKKKEA